MRSRHFILTVAVVTAFSLLGSPVLAYAGTLSTQPQEIKKLTFEPGSPAFTSNSAILVGGAPNPTAYWGTTSATAKSGSHSWWCAGTVYPSGLASSFWSRYPAGTRGLSTLSLPELASYYSSTASFYYLMPTRGGADDYSFAVYRQAADGSGNPVGPQAVDAEIPLSATWAQRTYDLTKDGISREPGIFSMHFYDFNEGPLQAVNGQGAAIDDLVVSGYKYGPVRSLVAVRSGTSVVLTWRAPATSTSDSADDTRAIGYRVWRSIDSDPSNWTELTSGRLTPVTFTDSSSLGVPVHYFVQAWDTGTGTGYGDPSGSSAAVTGIPDTTKPVTSISNLPAGWSTSNVQWSLTATEPAETWNTFTTYYRLAGASTAATTTYTTPVTTSAEGTTTITYWSKDQALNTEAPHTATVKIDKTAPVTTAQVSIGTSNTAIVTLSRVDNASGVAHTYYKDGQFGSTQEGTSIGLSDVHDIYYWSVDVAGNTEGQNLIHVDPNVPPIPAGQTRVYGPTRIDTAADISQKAFPNPGMATAAVVANGYGWTDALPATALAAAVHGPLLLTHSYLINGDVDSQVKAEIQRLGITTVYIVGNNTNIQPAVRSAIDAMPGVGIVNVSGGTSDVYTCSQQTAHQVKVQRGGTTGGVVFVARSDVFADALAASSLAAKMKAPIVLVPHTGTTIPAASIAALQDIAPATVVICGSTLAIPASVANAVQAAVPGATLVRKDGHATGTTRYDTALDLINYGTSAAGLNLNTAPDGIYIARGDDAGGGADALAGGVLAGSSYDGIWRPMMITAPASLSGQAAGYMDAHASIKWARIMGSYMAVSDPVYNQVGTHLH